MANDATNADLVTFFALPGDLPTVTNQHLQELADWLEDVHNPGLDDQSPPVQIPVDANWFIRWLYRMLDQQIRSHKRAKSTHQWGS